MATRNRRGRNLVTSNPNGSKVAYARFLALKKAELKGLRISDWITQCCSISAIERVEKQYNLNS
jgi:hypothetical protein